MYTLYMELNPFFTCQRLADFNIEGYADDAIRTQIHYQTVDFKQFETFIAAVETPTFADVFQRLEILSYPLNRTFGIIGHLSSVSDTPALREIKQKYISEMTELGDLMGKSTALFDALHRIDRTTVSETEARIIQLEIDGMKKNGFGLSAEKRAELMRLNKRMTEVSIKFNENVVDSTNAVYVVRPEHFQVVGDCPDFATSQWVVEGSNGYHIGMNAPSVSNALRYVADAQVRQEVYTMYIQRAGVENEPHVVELLTLRQERAELLGFATHTDYVLSDMMVRDAKELDAFYAEKLAHYAPMAQKEKDALIAFAGKPLESWDVAFYSNLKDKHDYGYTGADTKPFFELENVLGKFFQLCVRLFGVHFEEVRSGKERFPSTWHEDVRFFEVYDRKGDHRASLFYDPYVRPGVKRGGAWMNSAVDRSRVIPTSDKPVAYIVCNQSPPIDGVSLLTADEVVTLFHEMGHAINHMLSDVEHSEATGVPDEWDAVEIQSQMLELFATHRSFLETMTHHETGEKMPARMVDFIVDANSDKGLGMCRQMFLGNVDLEIHRNWKDIVERGESIWDVQERIHEKFVKHADYVPENRLLATFGHLFAGGYSSSYYGYMYSKEISKRLYASLCEAPTEEEQSRRGHLMLETVYAMGSSKSMGEIIELYFAKVGASL